MAGILCLVATSVLLMLFDGQVVKSVSPSQSTLIRASRSTTNAFCDNKCHVKTSSGDMRADCDNRQLTEIPTECYAASYLSVRHNHIARIEPGTFQNFSDLKGLILSHNEIQQVEPNAFSGASKLILLYLQSNHLQLLNRLALNGTNSDLQVVNLSQNKITDIEVPAFQPVPNLVTLDLSNNNLVILQRGVFDNLTHVTGLTLRQNKLKTIQGDLFEDLTSITSLDLSSNDIVVLPPELFKNLGQLRALNISNNQLIATGRVLLLPHIAFLHMQHNNLSRLDSLTEETLDRLQALSLSGNPWHCDCELEILRLWYLRIHSQTENRVYTDNPTCNDPLSLTEQPINKVGEGFCPNVINSTTYVPTVVSDEINKRHDFSPSSEEPSLDMKEPTSGDDIRVMDLFMLSVFMLGVTVVIVRGLLSHCGRCSKIKQTNNPDVHTGGTSSSLQTVTYRAQHENDTTPMKGGSVEGMAETPMKIPTSTSSPNPPGQVCRQLFN